MSFHPLIQSLQNILTSLIQFIPHFVNGLIILIVGYLVSWLIRWILRFVFRSMRLEQLLDRMGITRVLQSLGIHVALTEIIAQIVFYFLLLSFAIQAVNLNGADSRCGSLAKYSAFCTKSHQCRDFIDLRIDACAFSW